MSVSTYDDYPHAVHHTRRTSSGGRKSMPAVRNMSRADAEAYREHLLEDPAVVEAHVSLDTCG